MRYRVPCRSLIPPLRGGGGPRHPRALAGPGPPGLDARSYLVREFSRHLESIEADDGSGTRLPVVRLDKHRFRVDAGGSAQVRVRYRVYANDPTVRTSHLDGSHGYWNGANLFLYAEGGWRTRSRSRSRRPRAGGCPPPWRAARTASRRVTTTSCATPRWRWHPRARHLRGDGQAARGGHRRSRPPGRGTLRDGSEGHRRAPGRPHGWASYERYLFIVHLSDRRRGGLEHERSTTLDVGRTAFFPREAYEETLALAATSSCTSEREAAPARGVPPLRLRPRAVHPAPLVFEGSRATTTGSRSCAPAWATRAGT